MFYKTILFENAGLLETLRARTWRRWASPVKWARRARGRCLSARILPQWTPPTPRGFPARWPCGASKSARHARARYYLRVPYDLAALLTRREEPFDGLDWMRTAMEMQFIAQAGLAYSKDPYDLERFERLRELSATMLSRGSGLPMQTVRDVFLCEKGYQTPKIDTRAAIVENGRILLVQENTGLWALPGGWMDVDTTISRTPQKRRWRRPGWRCSPPPDRPAGP